MCFSDVVRFFGVGHFEKLRNQAKQGLQKMEEDGRIGGEPIKANRGVLATGQNPSGLTRGTAVDPSPLQRSGSPYTGEFSFERPGAGSFNFDPSTPPPEVELPSPENCAKKGKVFDPILQICVDPVVQPPAPSRRDDSDSAPTPTEPSTPWYETVNWTNPGETMENYFNQPSLPSLIGATIGTVSKTGYLSQARAMVQIYRSTGQFTKAQQVQDVIDTQLKESRGLGTTDRLIDSIFGSDGDRRTIQALRASGINVPNNIRLGRLGEEDELDDFLRNLNQTDRNRLRNMYGGEQEITTPEETITSEEITTPEEITTSKLGAGTRPEVTGEVLVPGTGETLDEITSPIVPRDYTDEQMIDARAKFEANQIIRRANEKLRRNNEAYLNDTSNDNFHQQMVQRHVERMQAQRDPMGQTTITTTYNTPSTGRFSVSADDEGLNKGGLMVKKKKKKK